MSKSLGKTTLDVAVVLVLIILTGGPLPLLLTLLSPYQQHTFQSLYLYSSVYRILYLCIILLFVIRLQAICRALWTERFLAALLLLGFLSTAWAQFPFDSFKAATKLTCIALFAAWFGTALTARRQMRLLTVAFTSVTVMSIACAIFWPQIGISQDPYHIGLWRGIFVHKNTLGSIMGLAVLSHFLTFTSERPFRASLLGLCLALFVLLCSGSKSSMLCCIVALIGPCLVSGSRKNWRSLTAGLLVVGCIGGCLLWQITTRSYISVEIARVSQPDLLERPHSGKDAPLYEKVEGKTQPRNRGADWKTLSNRRQLWDTVIEEGLRRPWLGFGLGNFWHQRGPQDRVRATLSWPVPHAHNGYLELWLQLGVLGTTLFLFSLAASLKASFLSFINRTDGEERWPFVFLCFWLLLNSVESQLVEPNSIFFCLYVSFALRLASHRIRSRNGIGQRESSDQVSLWKSQ